MGADGDRSNSCCRQLLAILVHLSWSSRGWAAMPVAKSPVPELSGSNALSVLDDSFKEVLVDPVPLPAQGFG